MCLILNCYKNTKRVQFQKQILVLTIKSNAICNSLTYKLNSIITVLIIRKASIMPQKKINSD